MTHNRMHERLVTKSTSLDRNESYLNLFYTKKTWHALVQKHAKSSFDVRFIGLSSPKPLLPRFRLRKREN